MKAYPAYKDSGIDWLGEIPAHWNLQRLKWLVREKLQYGANEAPESEDRSLPRYIRITDFGVDGKLKEDTFKSLSYEKAKEYLLTEGDILFARSGATVGKTFQFTNYKGSACFAGYLIKAVPDEKKIISDFLYAFTKSISYENWKKGIFIQATIQNIGADKYNSLPITVPPLPEQRAIAAFLDHKTHLIDTYITKKQQQIERLQVYRTALINQAVTKGLNPNAPMKDSGIEWLGEVPTHWTKGIKLNSVALDERGSFVNGPFGSDLLKSELMDTGVPVIYIRDIRTGVYQRVSKEHVTQEKATQLDVCRVDPGDVLITKVGDPPGTAAIYPFNEPPAIVTQDVIRIKPNSGIVEANYLVFLFNSQYGHALIDQISVESTRNRFGLGDLKNIRIILPPLKEQRAIIDYLDKQTTKIDTLIAKTQQQIDRLQAYRTSLISDAVTGKIDVRTDNYRDYT